MTDTIDIDEDRQLLVREIRWLIRPRSRDSMWLAEVFYVVQPSKPIDRLCGKPTRHDRILVGCDGVSLRGHQTYIECNAQALVDAVRAEVDCLCPP